VDVGYDEHFRIDHGNHEFAKGHNHINGIEGFWGVAKTRLAKFRGTKISIVVVIFKLSQIVH
jgi:hypothetical protein